MTYLYVALGGALGTLARFWLANWMAVVTGAEFPWGTLLINILGSFVISFFGFLTGTAARFAVPYDARVFVTVGICGGFTTFSSFSLQTLDLIRGGSLMRAMANILLSVTLCVCAVAVGHILAAHLNGGASQIAQIDIEEDA